MRLRLVRDDPRVEYVVGSLIVGIFFGGIGDGVAFPTLPNLGAIIGISPLMVGLILSTNRFSRLVTNTPAGQIFDRVGTRRPMIVGFLLQGLSPYGYAVALHPPDWLLLDSAGLFLVSRALWGVGSAFVFVGAFSTVTHITTPENRGRWIGYTRAAGSVGYPTGLVIGGIVADVYGYTEAFLVSGTLGAVAAVVAVLVLPDVRTEVDTVSRLRDLPALVRADPRILTVGAVNFVVRFLFAGVILSTVVLYAAEYDISIGLLSETGVGGVVLAASVLAISATSLVVGRVSDGLSNRALVVLPALGVFAGGFVLLALVPVLVVVIVAVVCVGIGVGGTNPPLLAYLGDISPGEDVGKLGGAYNAFGDLGAALGPLVAVPLVARVGFTVEYLGCAAALVLAGGLVAVTLLGEESAAPATSVPE